MSEPPAYRVAADHFDMCSSSADRVWSSNKLEAKDLRAMPAAYGTYNSTPHREVKTTSIIHHLVLGELEGCRNHLFHELVPFTGYTLKASARKPVRNLGH